MFPFGDNLRKDGRPWVIVLLLATLGLMHVPSVDPPFAREILEAFAFVPAWFAVHPWQNFYRLATSPLLHGDIFHLAGNALFLWVFGRSLERLFGHWQFLAAFPLLGSFGLLLHWVIYPNSMVPVIGASGAVATLMGAYLALFPKAKIKLFVWLGGIGAPLIAPAWVFLFYWIALESASLLFGNSTASGIAYAVHVGGFAVGVMGAIVWKVAHPFADEHLQTFLASNPKVQPPPVAEQNAKGEPSSIVWYVDREGQRFGPYDGAVISAMAEQGQLLATDYVWHTGLETWVPAFAYVVGARTLPTG